MSRLFSKTWIMAAVLLFSGLLPSGSPDAGETGPPVSSRVSDTEALRLGERMYREGILPSGAVMKAVVKGDIEVSATAFSCGSCHLRSGLGSFEGLVFTPPTTGRKLYQPLSTIYKGVTVASMPVRRPAYTDATLADALRAGVDPSGRTLDDVMPRYMLQDGDMAYLIHYLKSLSSEFSPGASEGVLHIATVFSEDVKAEERDAMLRILEDFVEFRNRSSRAYGIDLRNTRMAQTMLGSREAVYLDLKLSSWVLKGPPGTWRSQLEAYYRAAPVFALIGGIVNGEWRPVHDFSEENRIPALFPITDFPVISETDWYTLYLSKGYYQEGEEAARYLNSRDDLTNERAVVEIVRDSAEGRALSEGFRKTWEELGRKAPTTVMLKEGEELTAGRLKEIMAREKPAALMLWDGHAALPALEAFAGTSARTGAVFVSSTYLGSYIWTLRDDVKDIAYITYPFRLPQDESGMKFFTPFLSQKEIGPDARLVMRKTYSVIQVLARALMDLKGDYYRDRFLDVISMMADQLVPLYERLSFGPGQRYASKGCYIVQLDRTPKPRLIRRSDWVIH